MNLADAVRWLRHRIVNRSDAEHIQMAIRVVIVTIAMFYFHSDFFAGIASNADFASLARWAVSTSFAVTLALLLALIVAPGVSVMRRIIGLVHDVTAISVAMYLGEAGAAGVAAIYLWVTLGNGFRYGVHYLYACAVLSIIGFGTVYWFSDYWRHQGTVSSNILILLAVIPPYVGGLLKSLQRAKEQLALRASVDGLTGLMNRSELTQHLEAILAHRHEGHYLLFCDLDHFKRVNDIAGHAAGDKLLTDVGRIIKGCVRSDDLTARFGGDEFCVFIKRCPPERAREIAENIRSAVSGYRLAWGRDYFSVGISIGGAPSDAVEDMDSLFRLADAACYGAKNAGRNQVHIVDARLGLLDDHGVTSIVDDGITRVRPALTVAHSPNGRAS